MREVTCGKRWQQMDLRCAKVPTGGELTETEMV